MRIHAVAAAWLCCLMGPGARGGALSPAAVEFFEGKIRPVLAQDCYECHRTGGKRKGGLALDDREALLEGGELGPVIQPGNPSASLLIQAIRHERNDLKMPKSHAKLEPEVIADFELWVEMGAPDPRDAPATEAQIAADTSWDAVFKRRKGWWSLQPIRDPPIPEVDGAPLPDHPVDRFIGAKLSEAGLHPAGRADRRTLIRRLSFALKGLPPAPEEIERFLSEKDPQAFERRVDRFLGSPRFGECWARHWMDWVRYAESHGSEGDPAIPNAWRYRDYLIRALNADVPYDQLVREHLAGDLIARPRINRALGLNESAIGTAQLRMVFHGFAPTDALAEQVRFIDDEINVISKAFLGLTVSCARCHNHKFDAISQKDYYAWYGVLASCHPALIRIDIPRPGVRTRRQRLIGLKEEIKQELVRSWVGMAKGISRRLIRPNPSLEKALNQGEDDPFLWPVALLRKQSEALPGRWAAWLRKRDAAGKYDESAAPIHWNLAREAEAAKWFRHGPSVGIPAPAGTIAIAEKGDRLITGVYPAGTYSHLISTKDRGVLQSPRISLDRSYDLWVRVAGDHNAVVRYAVQDYPRNGTVYPVQRLSAGKWRWRKYALDYWQGDSIHLELSTAADQPVVAKMDAVRSWFGIQDAVFVETGSPFPPASFTGTLEPLVAALEDRRPANLKELASAYQRAARACLEAWRTEALSDNQALFLNALVQRGLLSNEPSDMPAAAALVRAYREREAGLPVPIRVPGLMEADAFDQPLFERGDHKKPGAPVPRRFLEAIDPAPFHTAQSGRLEFAEALVRPDNPLTARVIVNRVWHHLFGRGLVATPDNFGRLGDPPTHPELLDYLASWFSSHGRSIKGLIRFLVMSEAWQRSSTPPPGARERDPENRLWSHFQVGRLEAEAIRDALLAVSGELNGSAMYGLPVLGSAPRRSIYVQVKRNRLDPFLAVFDAPVPSATKGRRDATNVPAQSLTLLNDPFVIRLAQRWARRVARDASASSDSERIAAMFTRALARPPTPAELDRARQYLARLGSARESWVTRNGALNPGRGHARQPRVEVSKAAPSKWVHWAEALFNLKEFIYLP